MTTASPGGAFARCPASVDPFPDLARELVGNGLAIEDAGGHSESASGRMAAVIEPAILAAIHARLDRALARPAIRLRPFVVRGVTAGFVDDARAERLARFGPACSMSTRIAWPWRRDCVTIGRAPPRWPTSHVTLRSEGALPGWRDELYRVAATFDAEPLFHLERGAARYFGVRTYAAHVNGIVRTPRSTSMWLARRSPAKAIDPGLLDNLVGGGISAGLSVRRHRDQGSVGGSRHRPGAGSDCAAGRCGPSAALPAGWVAARNGIRARPRATAGFPASQPGRRGDRAPARRPEDAARTIAVDAGPEEVTVDASVVVLDFLIRNGDVRSDQPHFSALAALRYRGAGDPAVR